MSGCQLICHPMEPTGRSYRWLGLDQWRNVRDGSVCLNRCFVVWCLCMSVMGYAVCGIIRAAFQQRSNGPLSRFQINWNRWNAWHARRGNRHRHRPTDPPTVMKHGWQTGVHNKYNRLTPSDISMELYLPHAAVDAGADEKCGWNVSNAKLFGI